MAASVKVTTATTTANVSTEANAQSTNANGTFSATLTQAMNGRAAGARAATSSAPAPQPNNLSQQVSESIQTSVRSQQKEVVVQLNPPELGRVTIRFSGEGTQLTGVLEVSQKQTQMDLEQALPQVLRNLEANGVQIRKLDVQLNDAGDPQAQQNQQGERESASTAEKEDGNTHQGSAQNDIEDETSAASTDDAADDTENRAEAEGGRESVNMLV